MMLKQLLFYERKREGERKVGKEEKRKQRKGKGKGKGKGEERKGKEEKRKGSHGGSRLQS